MHAIIVNCELSMIKGCTYVIFSETTPGSAQLLQESINPTIYTKLSCHLPWIADQYDMVFDVGYTEQD